MSEGLKAFLSGKVGPFNYNIVSRSEEGENTVYKVAFFKADPKHPITDAVVFTFRERNGELVFSTENNCYRHRAQDFLADGFQQIVLREYNQRLRFNESA